jgi:hypothetical protein
MYVGGSWTAGIALEWRFLYGVVANEIARLSFVDPRL